jgi:hypothetical protein
MCVCVCVSEREKGEKRKIVALNSRSIQSTMTRYRNKQWVVVPLLVVSLHYILLW